MEENKKTKVNKIYRADVLLWESKGSQEGPCPKCEKTWIRLGLDSCCDEQQNVV